MASLAHERSLGCWCISTVTESPAMVDVTQHRKVSILCVTPRTEHGAKARTRASTGIAGNVLATDSPSASFREREKKHEARTLLVTLVTGELLAGRRAQVLPGRAHEYHH